MQQRDDEPSVLRLDPAVDACLAERAGLETDIAWQMWKTARPKSELVAPDPSVAPKPAPAPGRTTPKSGK